MHVADGPVGVVRQAVDALDRQHRSFEGAHAVEGECHYHHADDRVGANLVPGPVEGHQPVDHATPARHPQHDREDHAQRLRPVGQRCVVQVVRARPDVEEDQRPEVDDRQPVGIDRAFSLLGDEVIHHRQKARSEEEADRIVAVPPLRQRILHPGKRAVALGAQQAHRHRQVVDDVQHRNRHDEGEIEPVGDVDMRFLAARQRADEDHEIGNPDDRQPQVDVPFGLGIFLRLGNAEQVAGRCQHDEQLVAPEDEPREIGKSQLCAAGALHDVEARRQQGVAAEGEDHRAGMQRTQASEIEIGFEIQLRISQLGGDENARQKARESPEHGGDDAPANGIVVIPRRSVGKLEEAPRLAQRVEPRGADPDHHETKGRNDPGVRGEAAIRRPERCRHRDQHDQEPQAHPAQRRFRLHRILRPFAGG